MTLTPPTGLASFEAVPALNLTAAPVVELRGVTKRYGAVEALRGIDLVIRPGEISAILGPNGAGKTTALSLILGLRRPTSGTVRLLGLAPEHPVARARVGAMLQESGVPPMPTVAELVELFGSYYPHPRRAAEVIAAAGLTGLEGQRAGRLWAASASASSSPSRCAAIPSLWSSMSPLPVSTSRAGATFGT